jgi:hypothetical protein
MISSQRGGEPGAALLPRPDQSTVVIAPPGEGAGYWAGAPSAALGDDGVYLAYRLRRPLAAGRGYGIAVARSADGVHFQTLTTIRREDVGAESLERPGLVRDRDGRWRLYLSCATPGTKHWQIEVIQADHPAEFDVTRRVVVLPGDAKTGVKDPVIRRQNGTWQLWACCHPLADPGETDQMVTEYATSADGLDWTWHGTALSGRPGYWDSRGTRISTVWQDGDTITAFYDGRASAAENYEERTGVATGTGPTSLVALGANPAAESPYAGRGLRYLDVLALPGGGRRLYYEMTRPDGAHELRTELR